MLKGPQGTLFGRNTSAGAISIVTSRPDDRRLMTGTVQVGNYRKVRADATVNLPLTDTPSCASTVSPTIARASCATRCRGERREQENNKSTRAALRWAPLLYTRFRACMGP
ncbi:hypothetical protein AB5I41_08310 [Sphingomonas sp. MMS24-JH45]